MRANIAAVIILIAIVGGLMYADSRWGQGTEYQFIQPEKDYLSQDAWTCLMQVGVIDRANFIAKGMPSNPENTLIWIFQVTNRQREETRTVSIEYGYDQHGGSVMVHCNPPLEWMNWNIPPTVTPYVLPAEATNGGTPVS